MSKEKNIVPNERTERIMKWRNYVYSIFGLPEFIDTSMNFIHNTCLLLYIILYYIILYIIYKIIILLNIN